MNFGPDQHQNLLVPRKSVKKTKTTLTLTTKSGRSSFTSAEVADSQEQNYRKWGSFLPGQQKQSKLFKSLMTVLNFSSHASHLSVTGHLLTNQTVKSKMFFHLKRYMRSSLSFVSYFEVQSLQHVVMRGPLFTQRPSYEWMEHINRRGSSLRVKVHNGGMLKVR